MEDVKRGRGRPPLKREEIDNFAQNAKSITEITEKEKTNLTKEVVSMGKNLVCVDSNNSLLKYRVDSDFTPEEFLEIIEKDAKEKGFRFVTSLDLVIHAETKAYFHLVYKSDIPKTGIKIIWVPFEAKLEENEFYVARL